MVITVMSVATPMVSPSAVSEARSLCPRKASKHCARLSLTASMEVGKTCPFHLINSREDVKGCTWRRCHAVSYSPHPRRTVILQVLCFQRDPYGLCRATVFSQG